MRLVTLGAWNGYAVWALIETPPPQVALGSPKSLGEYSWEPETELLKLMDWD